MQKQKVECQFYDGSWSIGNFYTCKIEEKIISNESEIEFVGQHLNGKTNQNVKGIYFNNCSMSKLPQKLAKILPKLKIIYVDNSKLKSIERDDLKQVTDLVYVRCIKNEIKYIPGDLFADQKKLEKLDLSSNQIELIEPNLLDGLKNLKDVNFTNNPFISKCWILNDKNRDATLVEIQNDIKAKITSTSTCKMMYEIKWKLEKQFNAYKNGLSGDLMKIIQNDNLKDFNVTVNDEEFKVHKIVLAARSPVLKETIENNIDADSLNLIDISKEIFREILNFMYTDELPQSDDINFIHLYVAAEHLKVENLKKFAAEKLKDKINEENAFEVLTLANKYENEELKQKSFEKIKERFRDETIEINNDLASNPEKLKKYLTVKIKKDEMMKQISLEFENLLKENN